MSKETKEKERSKAKSHKKNQVWRLQTEIAGLCESKMRLIF